MASKLLEAEGGDGSEEGKDAPAWFVPLFLHILLLIININIHSSSIFTFLIPVSASAFVSAFVFFHNFLFISHHSHFYNSHVIIHIL